MKKIIFSSVLIACIALSLHCGAQPGYINTIAGDGTVGFSGDGGAATAATMGQALGAFADASGNVYIPDDDNNRIRKVSPSGIITTFAGGGTSTAEGILATAARINLSSVAVGGGAIDAAGNYYLIDDNRIRKVSIVTGIITTVAGTTTGGYSGDGGPATAAMLNAPHSMAFDAAGNMYIGDEGNARVRKVNTSGIISTIAGTGIAGFSGDGGFATAAELDFPVGICFDAAGNIYIADELNYRVRKIAPTGIISTFAGSGSSGFSGDGGPATAARFEEPSHVFTDSRGNLFITDFHNGRVRMVAPSGIITTYAGGGSSLADGVPATSASFGDIWGASIDNFNDIYIADRSNYRIRKVGGLGGAPTYTTDSFSVYLTSLCSGPSITIAPAHYSSAYTVKTWFGDGSMETDAFSAYSGYCWMNHVYSYPGWYTIKHVFYNGSTPVDSLRYRYNDVLCNNIPVQVYYDANGDCVDDSGDIPMPLPLAIAIDSNGVPIDTIPATSGFYYPAYGSIGDVYGFRVISQDSGFTVSCPASGIVYDTLINELLSYPTKYIGMQCAGSHAFDLDVRDVIPVTGIHDEWGEIYVQNKDCTPVTGTVTLHFSPKYGGTPNQLYPAATSVSGNTITWDMSTPLTALLPTPGYLHYSIWAGSTLLTVGDTVMTIVEVTPITGDADPSDNVEIIIDTVKAGCDPNEMSVLPAGCLPSGNVANLQYTIHFTNVGNDTAFNISVVDTLPANVDIKSLRIAMASNPMNTTVLAYGSAPVVKFDFQSINLLDSVAYPQCSGAVVFSVNTLPGLPDGSPITNHAGVFFDGNPVVLTNTVQNTVGDCNSTGIVSHGTTGNGLQLYPNPATTQLIVTNSEPITLLVITDLLGREVCRRQNDNSSKATSSTVNVAAFVHGMYIVRVNGIDVKKFVKS